MSASSTPTKNKSPTTTTAEISNNKNKRCIELTTSPSSTYY